MLGLDECSVECRVSCAALALLEGKAAFLLYRYTTRRFAVAGCDASRAHSAFPELEGEP